MYFHPFCVLLYNIFKECAIKHHHKALVCNDGVSTNQPEVTTIDPASTCKCREDIELISKDKFAIKCSGRKYRKKGRRTEETWGYTCPKTGFIKSFTRGNCKNLRAKAKKFLWRDCS